MSGPALIGAARLRELFDRHGVRPRQQLGQNFVIDPNTIRKVVDVASVGKDDCVLEIGAGAGSLTLALAGRAERVVALETDGRLVPVLEETVGSLRNVDIHQGDALVADLASFDATTVVANLPYNVATTVILRVLEEAPAITATTAMVQREVGERLAATAGSKSYGQTSVMVRYFATAAVAARVSRQAFYPVPDVDSVIVRVVRRTDVHEPSPRLFTVIRAAFSQRRKTLRNTLAPLAGSAQRAEDAVRQAGVDPGARAEQLDLDAFRAIERALR